MNSILYIKDISPVVIPSRMNYHDQVLAVFGKILNLSSEISFAPANKQGNRCI